MAAPFLGGGIFYGQVRAGIALRDGYKVWWGIKFGRGAGTGGCIDFVAIKSCAGLKVMHKRHQVRRDSAPLWTKMSCKRNTRAL